MELFIIYLQLFVAGFDLRHHPQPSFVGWRIRVFIHLMKGLDNYTQNQTGELKKEKEKSVSGNRNLSCERYIHTSLAVNQNQEEYTIRKTFVYMT